MEYSNLIVSCQRFVCTVKLCLTVTSTEFAPCSTVRLDVVFIIDDSGSVTMEGFRNMTNFIADVISMYTIGPNNIQVGVVRFSTTADRRAIMLAEVPTRRELIQEVLLLSPVTGGVTRTDLGLQAAENELTSSRSRDNVAKVAILLTDNRSTDPAATRAAATNIRNRGIEVFVIGIGPNVNVMELNEIATDLDSDHVQLASSFSMSVLGMLTDTLSNRTCVGKQLFCYMYVCINISS